METLTRLVSESLARHGFDRPLDYRRLQWSRWFRCESHHSLLCVPSKPGVFALAEEVMDLGPSEAKGNNPVPEAESRKPEAHSARRMLAVTQFFEDDDMAFVLDRMLSHNNSMRARLESGRYFVRFVEIQDQAQRRSICSALNQWIVSSSEKATGIGSHFASSLELAPVTDQTNAQGNVGRVPSPATAETGMPQANSTYPDHTPAKKLTPLEAVTATTVQRTPLFPSGF
jgi:hypothetical protein